MTTTVVLGAGGTVGLAYHSGVLKALNEFGGIEASDADLLIGTSAGSAAAAFLRSGYTSDDLWRMALGTHETLSGLTEAESAERRRALFTRNWTTPVDFVRTGIGTGYALLRVTGLAPALPLPHSVKHRFPAGVFTMEPAADELGEQLVTEWPARPMWLCAYDLVRRERVVLGGDTPTRLDVPHAVLASCAIPGMYRPVRDGRRVLVDGGVASTTNLDLVVPRAPGKIVVVAPMAYETKERQRATDQLTRRFAARALARETRLARAAGNEIVVIRPCRREVRTHGKNFMRLDTTEAVARLAYECAARELDSGSKSTAA
ncbi:MAG TPA: patatin-like phospholipase family protein [Acidimicrobiales bacterium]|jgi:NTE family protein|nr:patatin-like phospholipase family protein [Acidimicrobiales bacterium]